MSMIYLVQDKGEGKHQINRKGKTMKVYEWTTASGAKVEMTVSQTQITENELDGVKYEKTTNEMKIEKFMANGTEYKTVAYGIGNDKTVYFKMGTKKAGCLVPDEIYEEIIAPTMERTAKLIKLGNDRAKYDQPIIDAMNQ